MNVKKTIASIAAIAMVASATNLAPIFTGTSVAATSGTILNDTADRDHSGETTQRVDGVANCTADLDIQETDGTKTVTVTLTQTSEAEIDGTLQGGTKNYHVVIPVDGIDNSWDISGYSLDDENNKDWNVTTNLLRLWLPITAKEDGYTITLSKDSTTKTIIVKTVVVPYEAPATLTVGDPTSITGIEGGSGSAAKTENGGTTTIAVTLTPTAAGTPITGSKQNGADDGTENYHIVIPVTGLTTAGWTFGTGSQYGYDDGNNGATHPEWNIADGELKLWLPIADGGSCSVVLKQKEGTATKTIVVTTANESTEEIVSAVTVGTEATVRNDTVINGTGSAVVTAASGATPATVTVTLTPDGETPVTGLPQAGSDDPAAPKNYHITIPVTGLTTDWTFNSGYGFDSAVHTDNIDTNVLKLWLPVTNKEHTIVLKNGDETLTIKIKTIVNEPTVITPPAPEPEPGEEDPVTPTVTDEDKANAVYEILTTPGDKGVFAWEFDTWLSTEDVVYAANTIADRATAALVGTEYEGAVVEPVGIPQVGADGMTTFTFKIKVGNATITKEVTAKLGVPAPVIPDPAPAPAPAPAPIIYVPATSVSVSSGASASTVSSAKEIAVSRKSEITVNAAKTDVTPAMIKAFLKNKNTKTLTLKYSSVLKISISKNDINDADTNLDFSVSGKNFLSSKTIKSNKILKKASKIIQLDFVNKGKIEGIDKVTIKYNVGVNFMGKKATIYEYKNGKLVKVGVTKVNGAGLVKFNTDHLGQFVIVIE